MIMKKKSNNQIRLELCNVGNCIHISEPGKTRDIFLWSLQGYLYDKLLQCGNASNFEVYS